MPVPRSFVRGCRMLTCQFYHPLAIDLWEHLYKEKPASATIWVPVWSEWERYDTGFPFSWNAFHLSASLYHSCHLDTLFSAFKTQFIKWVRTSVTPWHQSPHKVSQRSCAAQAQYETYHVGHNHWLWLVPMSSLTRKRGKTVSHSSFISLPRFEPGNLVPWKKHRLGSETKLDTNSKSEK